MIVYIPFVSMFIAVLLAMTPSGNLPNAAIALIIGFHIVFALCHAAKYIADAIKEKAEPQS